MPFLWPLFGAVTNIVMTLGDMSVAHVLRLRSHNLTPRDYVVRAPFSLATCLAPLESYIFQHHTQSTTYIHFLHIFYLANFIKNGIKIYI
jgi:hypothetical protein